ncbi:lipoate---protein ligase family protein [Babesia bovis T2Bo]|uniref:BPL/LPL catalytic domain-containing protein n=1 Tax=Babesia bovis TaxID=5865 RepID=A7AW91_BABBO|nr:lipoate---protein ligase family protein [Babesia bovis T2Bo]EDO05319.1 lipoate---protein ligase family protein [Babesia bovis T2Bo]|eukprot:XP_001608887.1 hypothetical protein [Babesia bovis T2Bo]
MAKLLKWIDHLSAQTYHSLYTFQLDGIDLLRQLQFEEFLYRKVAPATEKAAFFIVNNHKRTGAKAVVMGFAGKPEQFVKDVEKTKHDGISIIKRFTGGGTVIVDENSLNTSIIASTAISKDISPTKICEWSYENIFKRSGLFNERFINLEGDYVVKGDNPAKTYNVSEQAIPYEYHKVAGNSQAFNIKAFVHHTVFPWNISPLISQLLVQPTKAPKYRQGRHHTEFMRCVTEALNPHLGMKTITDFEEGLCEKVNSSFGSLFDRKIHVTVSKLPSPHNISNAIDKNLIHLSDEFIQQAILCLSNPATQEC